MTEGDREVLIKHRQREEEDSDRYPIIPPVPAVTVDR